MNPSTDVSSRVPGRLRLPRLPGTALAGFVAAILAVAVIAWFSYSSLRETADLRARVTHTVGIIEALQTVQAILVDAETGQRGFLITGNDAYLEPDGSQLLFTSDRAGGWTPDGRAVIVQATEPQPALWLVPLDGSAPRKLEIDTRDWNGGWRLDPKGTHIAFRTGKDAREVWALESVTQR